MSVASGVTPTIWLNCKFSLFFHYCFVFSVHSHTLLPPLLDTEQWSGSTGIQTSHSDYAKFYLDKPPDVENDMSNIKAEAGANIAQGVKDAREGKECETGQAAVYR